MSNEDLQSRIDQLTSIELLIDGSKNEILEKRVVS